MTSKAPTMRHIRLICVYWCRHAVRSGSGLVYLMIALVFGLSVAHILIMPVEQLMLRQKREMGRTDPQAVEDLIVGVGRPITQWVLGLRSMQEIAQQNAMAPPSGADERSETGSAREETGGYDSWTNFLLEEKPALLSAILLVMLFGMPFVIPFLAFNQVSGDVQSRGLRYLLLRTERRHIYFGRFLGVALFSTLVMALIVMTIVLYLAMKIRIYPALALLSWAGQGFLALAILMLPYIAVCSLISASVDSPFLSLVLAKLAIAGVLLLAVLGGLAWKPAEYLLYLLPWGWQNHLLHPEPGHWLVAALACLVYTSVFLLLGYVRFARRDL